MKIKNVSDKILSGLQKIENRLRNKQATARRRSADTETTPSTQCPFPPSGGPYGTPRIPLSHIKYNPRPVLF